MDGLIKYIKYISGLLLFSALIISCKSNKKSITTAVDLTELQKSLNANAILTLSNVVYDLKGTRLEVKNKLILEQNAKIINGTLIGRNGVVECTNDNCLNNILLSGEWKNESMPLNWFTTGEDAQLNFKILCNLIDTDKKILVDKMYPLSTSEWAAYQTNASIKITGTNPNTSGFILKTKHKQGKAYFQSTRGNNIHLENLSLTTDDYEKNIEPNQGFYRFSDCSYSSLYPEAKPSFEHFILKNCTINGAVQFSYAAHSNNTTLSEFQNLGIKKIEVLDCTINKPVNLLTLSNLSYGQVEIKNNSVHDLLGPVFFFPISGIKEAYLPFVEGPGRPLLILESNKIKNTRVYQSIHNAYMSFVVAKGNNFKVINNTFENILNSRDGVETYAFYCSAANELYVHKNLLINCASKGLKQSSAGNCLIKLKNANNCIVLDNVFRLEKQALVDLGVLRSPKQALKQVKAENFRFSIFGSATQDNDNGSYIFKNNTFDAAVISDYCWIGKSNFIFNDNIVNIKYFPKTDEKRWGGNLTKLDQTLFYFKSSISNGHLEIKNNKITVEEMDKEVFHFTYNQNDNKQYQKAIYEDNQFNINGVVSLFFPRSENVTAKNKLFGKGSIVFNQASTIKKNRSIKQFKSEQIIDEYYASPLCPYHLKNTGKAVIKTLENKDSIASVLRVNYNDLYDIDRLPIDLEIRASFIDTRNVKKEFTYKILFKDYRNAYFIDHKSNKVINVKPYWMNKDAQFSYDILPVSSNVGSNIRLSLVSQTRWPSQHKYGYILFRGLEDIKSFEISAAVNKMEFSENIKSMKQIKRFLLRPKN